MTANNDNVHPASSLSRTDWDSGPSHRTIYLARHGAIENPGHGKFYIGQSDLALSPEGHCQAMGLAEKLRKVSLEAIFTSDLSRTIETAAYTARMHGLTPIPTKELREIDLGQWEGLPFEAVKKDQPAAFAQRGRDIVHFRPPQGESFMDLSLRVIPALFQITDQIRGNILIVGHAGVNRIILSHAMGTRLDQIFNIQMDHTTLYRLACRNLRLSLIDASIYAECSCIDWT